MSWISSPDSALSGGWLSSQYAGLGATGAAINAASSGGESGPGPLYSLGLIDASEYYWRVTSAPASGSLTIYEDGSFSHTGAADGSWSWTASVYTDGVLSYTLTITDSFGATARITTDPFKSYNGSILGGAVIPHVMAILPNTAGVALTLSNQTTASDGSLTIENAAISAGVAYLVVSFDDTGASRGAKTYTAA